MRALGCVAFAVVIVVPLLACEAVVDLGSYTGSCSPISDHCPKGSPCVWDPDATGFSCQPHSGQKGQDNLCASEADCYQGFACEIFTNAKSGHCTAYCTKDGDCASGTTCIGFGKSRYDPTSGKEIGGCGPLTTPCDPLTATSTCPTGKRCTLYDTDYTKCDTLEEMRGLGQACDYLQQCAPGSSCIGGTCRKLCDFAVMNNCAMPTTCQDYSMPRMLGTKHIGVCVPP
jgi:hypothetical protein